MNEHEKIMLSFFSDDGESEDEILASLSKSQKTLINLYNKYKSKDDDLSLNVLGKLCWNFHFPLRKLKECIYSIKKESIIFDSFYIHHQKLYKVFNNYIDYLIDNDLWELIPQIAFCNYRYMEVAQNNKRLKSLILFLDDESFQSIFKTSILKEKIHFLDRERNLEQISFSLRGKKNKKSAKKIFKYKGSRNLLFKK